MSLHSLFEFLRACLNLGFLNVITFLRVMSTKKLLRLINRWETLFIIFLSCCARKLALLEEQNIAKISAIAMTAKI